MVRILVIDDDTGIRRAVAWLLARRGARVTALAQVEAALATPGTFDGVVTDFDLPDGTGLDLLEGLAASGRSPDCAVLITAYPDCVDRVRAASLGVTTILPKPIAPAALLRAVDLYPPALGAAGDPSTSRALREH